MMIGSTISHYKILEKLGEGGMGVVYKAEDIKLKRTVALKFLPQHLAVSTENKQRLTREAQSASVLNHPNISHIYEIDEVEGETFIAMEFIEGRMLRTSIDAGPLKVTEAVTIAIQIAEGLKAAHKCGIIHRDIKPENVIITEEGIAKIADFGLAKKMERTSDSDAKTISGTTAYMSPEQLQGQHVDHLTDIWSLGVVLYEMVSGQRPFSGEYDQAVMYSIMHEKPHPIVDVRGDVPSALTKIIDRCLEKIPGVRFPDAEALLDELHRIKYELKNPRTSVSKSIAVLPFADLSPEKNNEYFSDGLTEEIITNLSKLRLMRVVSRTTLMQYERAKKTTKQIAADLGVQYILEGSVRKHGSDLRITAQLVDASQDVALWAETYKGTIDDIFDIQETVAARIVKALRVRLSPGEKKTLKRRSTENTEAYQLYLKGRFFWNKRNSQALETAIRYFEEAIEKDSRYALAWAGLSDAYNLISEYGTMTRKETYPKAKAAVGRALELDGQLAEARASLASVMMLDEWDWVNAEKEFKLAITLNPNYATAHHWYAEWLLFTGKTEEAVKEISLAAELDPLSPAILKDKGMTLYYARRYDDAIEEAGKTLELDPNFASAHRLLSLAYQGKGMYPEALFENQRWGELTSNRAEALTALAQLHAKAGRRADAVSIIEGLILEGPTGGNVLRGIALAYAALGEIDPAFRWLEKAYEVKAESLCSLKVDPKADMLRSDPRFRMLLKNIGLEI